jgi:hypothetical protein
MESGPSTAEDACGYQFMVCISFPLALISLTISFIHSFFFHAIVSFTKPSTQNAPFDITLLLIVHLFKFMLQYDLLYEK